MCERVHGVSSAPEPQCLHECWTEYGVLFRSDTAMRVMMLAGQGEGVHVPQCALCTYMYEMHCRVLGANLLANMALLKVTIY